MRVALLLSLVLVCGTAAAEELIVYSERKEPLIQPIFATYTKQTGVQVKWLTDAAPVLIERLAAALERIRREAARTDRQPRH